MRRVLAAALCATVLLGSALVAQASSLTVDAGVLQTLTMPAEIDVPDDPVEYVAVQVVLRRYRGQLKNYEGADSPVTYLVPTNRRYIVGFAGTELGCPSDIAAPRDTGTFGPFSAGPVTHTLCVQQSHTGLTLTIEEPASGP